MRKRDPSTAVVSWRVYPNSVHGARIPGFLLRPFPRGIGQEPLAGQAAPVHQSCTGLPYGLCHNVLGEQGQVSAPFFAPRKVRITVLALAVLGPRAPLPAAR